MNTPGWLRGLAAAAAGVGATEALTAARGQRSFIDAAGQLVVDAGPRPVVEHTVRLLRTADKPVLRAAVIGTVYASGALLGRVARGGPHELAAIGGLAAAGALASRRTLDQTSRREAVAAASGGAACAAVAMRAGPRCNRAAGVGGTVALLAALRRQAAYRTRQDQGQAAQRLQVAAPLPPTRDGGEDWPGVSPLHTPVPDFYVTDATMRPPTVDVQRWRLAITGLVGRPLSLRYDELVAQDLVEFDAAMVCVHNRVGWNRLGNQRWTGLPLLTLLGAAEPHPSASVLVTGSVDGWECSLPLPLLAELEAYLVVGMDGTPLTAAHGFPARVFVPGLYGQYTGAKWLTELRLQAEPNRDYWLPRGWPSEPARVRPLSRIDAPAHRSHRPAGPLTVTGVAWAPPFGVQSVQIAIDDHRWVDAELAEELAPAAWRRWRAMLTLPAGNNTVRARCVSRDGTLQDAMPRPPFPTGASGYHHIAVIGTDDGRA